MSEKTGSTGAMICTFSKSEDEITFEAFISGQLTDVTDVDFQPGRLVGVHSCCSTSKMTYHSISETHARISCNSCFMGITFPKKNVKNPRQLATYLMAQVMKSD
jgi:hypothetical protein